MSDLLDLGLLEHGNFSAHEIEFSPRKAVSQIAGVLVNYLKNFDVQVELEYDQQLASTLIGDVDRVQQVLMNLISNARKFVPKVDGIIKIQTSTQGQGDDSLLKISVLDNGPGISAQDKKRLFRPFSKLKASAHLNPNGNGLGLSICK